MIVLELFSGTGAISNAFKAAGDIVFSVDWDIKCEPSLHCDIEQLTVKDILNLCGGKPDIIWASPDCTTYSLAGISHHRVKENGTLKPISAYAFKCDCVNTHVIDLIKELNPTYWFIENPRGGLRKMPFMQGLPRYTVTYCQYGEDRMKPTDIWTNHQNPKFKQPCKNGDSCHERAPRGSKTGTQGIKGKLKRAAIPEELCKHIVEITRPNNDKVYNKYGQYMRPIKEKDFELLREIEEIYRDILEKEKGLK